MFNKQDLRVELRKNMNKNLQNFFCRIGLKSNLKWELREDNQCVSNCFSNADGLNITSAISVLKQSDIFISVSIVPSRNYKDQLRILLKTDSVSHLDMQFKHAEYVNALIDILPVSGIICTPARQSNLLILQPCAAKNSFEKVPNLLKLLEIPWIVLSSSKIAISCDNVKDLILRQKKLCLDLITDMTQQVQGDIQIRGQATHIQYFSSSPGSVMMNFCGTLWNTTPGIIMNVRKNPYTLAELNELSPDLLEVKVSGYYDSDQDSIMPCGIKLNNVFDIPLFLKNKMMLDMKQERSKYLNQLLVFKGTAKEYGIPSLPFDVTKKVLIEACDNSCFLTEKERGEAIEALKTYQI
jgi:hypothetical protein